jgi:hemolysin D
MSTDTPKMNKTTPEDESQHPFRALIGRYRAIGLAAWSQRQQMDGPLRMADEVAFLPAALSLQETPPHPLPRRLAWLLMALFLIALVWSVFGRVDIVAVAPGRIVVSDRTKVIQPLEASVVRRVMVKDGDVVQAGQVLVELDATVVQADQASLREQYLAAWSEELRSAALIQALRSNSPPMLDRLNTISTNDAPLLQAQLDAEWQDIRARRAKLNAEIARRESEIATVNEMVNKLEATLPLSQRRETDYQSLVSQGFISSHATQDRSRERLEQERDLATQRARLKETHASLLESTQSLGAYLAETRRSLQERHFVASTKRAQLQAEADKLAQRERLTQLISPVNGVVQQLSVHSVGGVVTSAQPLMVIVPTSEEVTAVVNVANLDIGFVNVGQEAEIKLETFSYTKYGTVKAKVTVLSSDAVTDEKSGASFYPATLTLMKRQMDIDGKQVAISPGMNVTAEIKTGKRRIIEFLLSPIERTRQESLRER